MYTLIYKKVNVELNANFVCFINCPTATVAADVAAVEVTHRRFPSTTRNPLSLLERAWRYGSPTPTIPAVAAESR